MRILSYPFEVCHLSRLKQDGLRLFYLFLNDLNVVTNFDYIDVIILHAIFCMILYNSVRELVSFRKTIGDRVTKTKSLAHLSARVSFVTNWQSR